MSAFQALGPFISTFANPNMTGLYFDEDGILRVEPLDTCNPPVVAAVAIHRPQSDASSSPSYVYYLVAGSASRLSHSTVMSLVYWQRGSGN